MDIKAPDGIVARGRNRYFDLARVEVITSNENAWVDFYSKTPARTAPMLLRGAPDKIRELVGRIAEQLNPTAKLGGSELATILAALRYYQWKGMYDVDGQQGQDIHDISTNNGEVDKLEAADIDALCERLNTSEVLVI